MLVPSVAGAASFPPAQLPPYIKLVVDVGERADWSADSKRIIYVNMGGGAPFEKDIVNGGAARSILPPGLPATCWRIYYLQNGDFLFTCGATRATAGMYIVDQSLTKPAVSMNENVLEGAAVARNQMKVAWHPSGGAVYLADIVYNNGVPALANKTLIIQDSLLPRQPNLPPEDTINYNGSVEPQNFIPPAETSLTFVRYGQNTLAQYTSDCWGVDFTTKALINYSKDAIAYDECDGIFTDGLSTLMKSNKALLPNPNISDRIDQYRVWLDGSGKNFKRLTYFSDVKYDATTYFKGTNGVVSPDSKYIAFQEGLTSAAPGAGFGIYLIDMAAAGIALGPFGDGGVPTADAGPGSGPMADAAGAGGTTEAGGTTDAGATTGTADATLGADGGGADAASGADGATTPSGGVDAAGSPAASGTTDGRSGCACRTSPGQSGGAAIAVFAALGASALRRRRVRR
jgi:MYXO-CTERM domain-containing protein